MTGLDSNVLVRYLVEDEPAQAARARRFIAESKSKGEAAFISDIVLCELVWVLRSVYRRPKPDILKALAWILNTDLFVVEDADSVRKALQRHEAGPGDFAGHLIGEIHLDRGCRHTVTFDRAMQSAPGFSPL